MKPGGWVHEIVDERDTALLSRLGDFTSGDSPDASGQGVEALVDGTRSDWAVSVAKCIDRSDRVTVVLGEATSRRDVLRLLSMGFRIVVDGEGRARAVRDRSAPSGPLEEWDMALVGPLAHTLFGDLPGAFRADDGHVPGSKDTVPVVADSTPWAVRVDESDFRAAGGSSPLRIQRATGDAEHTVVPSRIAVDMVGALPAVLDRVEPGPVIAPVDVGMPADFVASVDTLMDVEGLVEERIIRPPGSRWRTGRRPGLVLRDSLRGGGAVLVASGAFRNQADRAMMIVVAGSLGIPVIADDVDSMSDYLGPGTLEFVASMSSTVAGAGPFLRDAIGVALHRQICREHSDAVVRGLIIGSGDRKPSVTVVAVTDAPDEVTGIAATVGDQTFDLELVVAVRGHQERVDLLESPTGVHVLGRPALEPIGSALNACIDRASGEIVVVWRPGDLYSPTHVEDLCWGLRSARAEVVGKGDEFVYVEELDVTVQRSPDLRWSQQTALGGSIASHRSVLREIGGLPGSTVDPTVGFARRVRRGGGRAVRLHGYGHLVRATEIAGDVLTDAVRQWPGLAMAEAGVADEPVEATRRYTT